MKEESDFLENLYKDLRFSSSVSSRELMNRLYLRHRCLYIKNRYGYEASLSVSVAGRAELARNPSVAEDHLEQRILTVLAKVPKLGQLEQARKSFQHAKQSSQRGRRGPKRMQGN